MPERRYVMDYNAETYLEAGSILPGLISSDAQRVRAFIEYVRQRQDTADFPVYYSDNFSSDLCCELFNLDLVYGEEYKDKLVVISRLSEYHLHMSLARLRWLFEIFPKQKSEMMKPFFDFLASRKVNLDLLLAQFVQFVYLLSCMQLTEQIMKLDNVRAKDILYVKFKFTGNLQGVTLQGAETKAFLEHLLKLEQAALDFAIGSRVDG